MRLLVQVHPFNECAPDPRGGRAPWGPQTKAEDETVATDAAGTNGPPTQADANKGSNRR